MGWELGAVDQYDCNALGPGRSLPNRPQVFVGDRGQLFAIRRDPASDLDDLGTQRRGPVHIQVKERWPSHVPNANQIRESFCDHQQDPDPFALQQGVGGHRGAECQGTLRQSAGDGAVTRDLLHITAAIGP
jgi:hypothetical protein